MSANSVATSTAKLFENLGHGMIALVRSLPEDIRYIDEQTLGKQIDGLIAAALKSVAPGRQTSKQIREQQQAARQAVARKLARKVAKLG